MSDVALRLVRVKPSPLGSDCVPELRRKVIPVLLLLFNNPNA